MSTRSAVSDDAPQVIPLIMEAIGSIAYLLTGTPDEAETTARLTDFFKQPGNRISYTHVIVEERDGRTAGMLVAYSGNEADKLDEPFRRRILRDFGQAHSGIIREARDGEFYLDALAVAEDFRGQGIASLLMAAAEQRALEQGFNRTALIVESGNERAHRLYARNGYREADMVRIGGGDYRRMAKELKHLQH
ncbi:GNAT family N-acetyltransferase [Paenibacillus sp. R14(2021)]|uniref:GNAT family N-acetyltransferase n=1 Tax=Paenibacillus sp. R14(2021) TaxID=2859228 RepID=UPI001C6131EA|nr:GNAT family N-acetyltransferase [Paenibacillus sp. R14(2021)]